MIETTITEVDGVRFIKDIRILEPDDKVGGFPIHRISFRIAKENKEFMRAIKTLGLRRVGTDLSCRSYLYTQSYKAYIGVKFTQFLLRAYWFTIRWLYANARMFQEIPPNCSFSWCSFTPYVWYKNLIGRK